MSKDMRLTWMLRGTLWLVAFVLLFAVAGVVDLALNDLHQYLFGKPFHKWIESVVFYWLAACTIWRWLSRRVWVGREQRQP